MMKSFCLEQIDILTKTKFAGFTPQMNLKSLIILHFNDFGHPIDH